MRISNSRQVLPANSVGSWRCCLWIVLIWLGLSRSGLAEPPVPTPLGSTSPVADQTTIADTAINESSGMSFSMRDPGCVWTHNDSGDLARLFCLDVANGARTGSCELVGVDAIDWESMTSVPALETGSSNPQLIVADSGDNRHVRGHITLYRFDEPDPRNVTELGIDEYRSLNVRFPSGANVGGQNAGEAIDCEAIWFDPAEQAVVLLAKNPLPIAGVYLVPMSLWSTPSSSTAVMAKRVATLALPFVTGADRDPQNGDVWLVTYWQAFCYRRSVDDTLALQLARVPEAYSVPKWKQIEAVSVDHRSRIWITTEGTPAFLGRLTCLKSN
ncbi:hypothetical protein [Neorhodopirellula pilleata]|uniref:Integral membrane protein n=1 Tax=Neorhodopirellula pilleata TaxID=2714738 RepID=A0A5C6AQQ9_9BACT|nr:hypothetical protein [Neorhodopirellula pilleata]TWU01801.1 hypothetical protein Pla100_15370 [Neorhodopirellula pilleata]